MLTTDPWAPLRGNLRIGKEAASHVMYQSVMRRYRNAARSSRSGTGIPAHRPARPRIREAIADGIDGPEGWPLYLDRYAALLKEGR